MNCLMRERITFHGKNRKLPVPLMFIFNCAFSVPFSHSYHLNHT